MTFIHINYCFKDKYNFLINIINERITIKILIYIKYKNRFIKNKYKAFKNIFFFVYARYYDFKMY